MTPTEAYDLALKQGPADETRRAACQNPWTACLYARNVDRGPRDDTRAVCQLPYYAYFYAHDVEKCGQEDTREVVCQDPYWAYRYARDIDRRLHPKILLILTPVGLARARELLEFD